MPTAFQNMAGAGFGSRLRSEQCRGSLMLPIWKLTAILMLALLVLAGCGDDFATYNRPANPDQETEWHRCMRQSSPIGRSSKWEDVR
jgi:hypothetical protein